MSTRQPDLTSHWAKKARPLCSCREPQRSARAHAAAWRSNLAPVRSPCAAGRPAAHFLTTCAASSFNRPIPHPPPHSTAFSLPPIRLTSVERRRERNGWVCGLSSHPPTIIQHPRFPPAFSPTRPQEVNSAPFPHRLTGFSPFPHGQRRIDCQGRLLLLDRLFVLRQRYSHAFPPVLLVRRPSYCLSPVS